MGNCVTKTARCVGRVGCLKEIDYILHSEQYQNNTLHCPLSILTALDNSAFSSRMKSTDLFEVMDLSERMIP
jgi:hypothetical protein